MWLSPCFPQKMRKVSEYVLAFDVDYKLETDSVEVEVHGIANVDCVCAVVLRGPGWAFVVGNSRCSWAHYVVCVQLRRFPRVSIL